MADATSTTSSSSGSSRRGGARNNDDLETQIERLQKDISSIAQTLTRMGGDKVDEVRGEAKAQARQIVATGQHALDDMAETAGHLESSMKRAIRDRPLTTVAAAVGIGFLAALLSRR